MVAQRCDGALRFASALRLQRLPVLKLLSAQLARVPARKLQVCKRNNSPLCQVARAPPPARTFSTMRSTGTGISLITSTSFITCAPPRPTSGRQARHWTLAGGREIMGGGLEELWAERSWD